ncbi:MAG: AraC family transcriptional regulator [Gemmatimonadales bacterium]|nr:AraC family transcriptional regulator [Gemmatimonadales bacterium]
MHSPLVPITTGADSARTNEVGPFRVTYARFPAGGVIPPHTHDRACLAIMLRGSFDLRFPGKQAVDCQQGSTTLEPLGDTHANYIGNGGAEVLVLQPDATEESMQPLAGFLDGHRHLADPGLVVLARRILSELRAPDEVSMLAVEGLALELLAASSRVGKSESRGARAHPGWLKRAADILHAEFASRLSLAGIAREVDVHPVHFTRTFRAHYRCSPGEFVRRRRLEWAAERLLGSDDSIAAIAIQAGFTDQSHFTRRFRRHTGTTPQHWRRTHGRPLPLNGSPDRP